MTDAEIKPGQATVPIRLQEGDTIILDNSPYTVTSIGDGEVQLATPGGFHDVVYSPADVEQKFAEAERIDIFR